jgi:hypothetical protein
VNANSANINTVAGSNTAINTVSTNIVAVNSAYTNLAAIIDAPNQAAAAANSAAQAAASAASGMYSAVQDKSANYTIVAADAGDLIRVTTTSGAVTITLPLIGSTGITDGFKIAIVKWTADANAVNIARSGSNTINGATSAQIGSQYSQIILVADGETSTWFASQSGLGATNINVDTFNGTGSATAFTLTSDPSTKNNTTVFISGVYQQKSTYSLSGTTLTFSTAPPAGTGNIEVAYSTPLAIGTPSDGTVTNAKLAAGAVDNSKMAAGAAVANIGYTPVNKAGDTMTGPLIIDYGSGDMLSLRKGSASAALSLGSSTTAQALIEAISGGGVQIYSGSGSWSGPSWSSVAQFTTGRSVLATSTAKAWCCYDGSSNSILNSFNVSSVTEINANGVYQYNFTNAFSSNVYSGAGTIGLGGSGEFVEFDARTTSNAQMILRIASAGGRDTAGTQTMNVMFFGT